MFLQRLLPRDSDEFTLGCGLPRTRADASHTVIRGLVSCIDGDAPLAFDIIEKDVHTSLTILSNFVLHLPIHHGKHSTRTCFRRWTYDFPMDGVALRSRTSYPMDHRVEE